MFTKNNLTIKSFAYIFLIFISFLFGIKYLDRTSIFNSMFLSIGFHFLVCLVIFYFGKINYFQTKVLLYQFYLIPIIFLVIHMFFPTPDLAALKVDRWSAIVYWWDAFFCNVYPYFSRTHVGGFHSPSPFLEFVYLPGYLLKDIGIINLLAYCIFFCYMINKNKAQSGLMTLILFFSSIAVLWEIYVRSSLILNTILVFFFIEFLTKFKGNKLLFLLLTGCFCGFLLSTRISMVLVIIPAFIFLQKQKKYAFFDISIVGFVTLFCFILTFVPFIFIWDWASVLKSNPITHQQKAMPLYVTIFILITSIYLGCISITKEDLLFFCGLILFLTGVIFELYAIYNFGFDCGFLKGCGDISYINAAIPFFLAVICTYKTIKT